MYLWDFPVHSADQICGRTRPRQFGRKIVCGPDDTHNVVQRCVLMTTDPGDLVLDPTCGSGTTAYVAEQWGRRWITIDTSRVPLALARQRLLTATFPYYELKDDCARPGWRIRVRPQAEQQGRGSRRHRAAHHAGVDSQQRAAQTRGARRRPGDGQQDHTRQRPVRLRSDHPDSRRLGRDRAR